MIYSVVNLSVTCLEGLAKRTTSAEKRDLKHTGLWRTIKTAAFNFRQALYLGISETYPSTCSLTLKPGWTGRRVTQGPPAGRKRCSPRSESTQGGNRS